VSWKDRNLQKKRALCHIRHLRITYCGQELNYMTGLQRLLMQKVEEHSCSLLSNSQNLRLKIWPVKQSKKFASPYY